MEIRMVLMLAFVWIGQSSFGQTNEMKNNLEDTSSKNITVQSKDPSITNISVQKQSSENSSIYYSEKEWKKIKRQIRRNKKRITSSKDGIHTSKRLDTIYLEIKVPVTNTQITDW